MPANLCRHISPTGHHCNTPTTANQKLYCHFHHRQHRLTDRPKRPCNFSLNLQFPEDRASIQLNFAIVQQAVVEGRLEPRQAHAIISANRAAAANLKAGPLTPSDLKNRVERVILTPDEREIAPARQVCSPGEVLTHGPECPCDYCAETYRGAPGELHHPDCNCGLCRDDEAADDANQQDANQPEGEANQPQSALNSALPQLTEAEALAEAIALHEAARDAYLARKAAAAAQGPHSDQREASTVSTPHPTHDRHSEQSEESAVTLAPPHPSAAPGNNSRYNNESTGRPLDGVSSSIQRTNPDTSAESIIYSQSLQSTNQSKSSESITSTKNLENTATKNADELWPCVDNKAEWA
jgi:hypothetical protein